MSSTDSQRENIEKLNFTGEIFKNSNFIANDHGGIVIQTCKHMIHYECLNSFKEQNIQNRARTLLIEDFNINEFSCPLCKSYCNAIIPPWKEIIEICQTELQFNDLLSYDSTHDSSKYKMRNFFQMLTQRLFPDTSNPTKVKTSVLSMLLDLINIIRKVQCGDDTFHEILPVDLISKKENIAVSTISYINH